MHTSCRNLCQSFLFLCRLLNDDQQFLQEQAGLLAGALRPQVKEVTKSNSSKSSSSPKKKGLRYHATPLNDLVAGARFELATFGL